MLDSYPSSFSHTFPFIPRDIFSFWNFLNQKNRHAFFFGSGAALPHDHVITMSLEEPKPLLGNPLKTIDRHLKQEKPLSDAPRFVGFLSFSAGRVFDPGIGKLPCYRDPLKTPQFYFCETSSHVKIDLIAQTTTLVVMGKNKINRFAKLMQKCEEAFSFSGKKPGKGKFTGKIRFLSSKGFSKRVVSAKKAIQEGDVYQANLSFRFERRGNCPDIELYEKLCRDNPSPYACLLRNPWGSIVSCSPELLLEVKGNKAFTRPIAGTRPRGKSRTLDSRKRGQLLLSPKEKAEHIMLVDLERNDLGRVSVPGSVKVTERTAIERYSHVMHIVSQVEGRLDRGLTSVDALKALFPGGTITGCPKIRSIGIIESLEKESRGPFYGSAGFFCWNGDAKFNILIRTALLRKNRVFVQAGAGIVADSHPKREYKEVLAKAQVLLNAIKGGGSSPRRKPGSMS